MNHRLFILTTWLMLAALLVGWAAGGPAAEDGSPATSPVANERGALLTPTPKVLVSGPPGWDLLPEGCSPERVVRIVQALIDAINRGDEAQLTALFRPDILDADGTPWTTNQLGLGWFGVEGFAEGRHGVWVRSGAELAAWAAARHARGERWTLLKLAMAGYWWQGGVNIGFAVRREAADLPAVVLGGKGAIDCTHGTVFMWSMAGPDRLPDDLFEPGATPWGMGFVPSRSRS